MKIIKVLVSCAALTVFAVSNAVAYSVDLRGNNKTDTYLVRITEGWVINTPYYIEPRATLEKLMFLGVASNVRVAYKGPADAEFIDLPNCGGGNFYYTTLTVVVENPTEGSNGVPLCSIL